MLLQELVGPEDQARRPRAKHCNSACTGATCARYLASSIEQLGPIRSEPAYRPRAQFETAADDDAGGRCEGSAINTTRLPKARTAVTIARHRLTAKSASPRPSASRYRLVSLTTGQPDILAFPTLPFASKQAWKDGPVCRRETDTFRRPPGCTSRHLSCKTRASAVSRSCCVLPLHTPSPCPRRLSPLHRVESPDKGLMLARPALMRPGKHRWTHTPGSTRNSPWTWKAKSTRMTGAEPPPPRRPTHQPERSGRHNNAMPSVGPPGRRTGAARPSGTSLRPTARTPPDPGAPAPAGGPLRWPQTPAAASAQNYADKTSPGACGRMPAPWAAAGLLQVDDQRGRADDELSSQVRRASQ